MGACLGEPVRGEDDRGDPWRSSRARRELGFSGRLGPRWNCGGGVLGLLATGAPTLELPAPRLSARASLLTPEPDGPSSIIIHAYLTELLIYIYIYLYIYIHINTQ